MEPETTVIPVDPTDPAIDPTIPMPDGAVISIYSGLDIPQRPQIMRLCYEILKSRGLLGDIGRATVLLLAVLCFAGCGGPYVARVYGHSGTAYTAPTLCGALVACLNSTTETACFYDRNLVKDVNGTTETDCKEVKK
jgi:hypothetical protein